MFEQKESPPEQELDDVSVEDSFNTLVKLARNAKLTYNEHALVDRSVRIVHRALNRTQPSTKVIKDQSSSEDASQEK